MNKDLKKYMSSGKVYRKILIGLGAVLTVVFLILCLTSPGINIPGLLVTLLPIALIVVMLLLEARSKKFYKQIEETYNWQEIEADYQSAISVMKNTLRFGENWIFVRNREQLLQYQEITKIYQYIHKTNFAEDERALKYINAAGKECVLCKLQLNGKSDEDVKQILTILLAKNPYIEIGY